MIDIPAEVKNALREGNRPKNYRFIVLNDNGTENFTIDNNNIVAESVKIDERLCSGDTLKYGLCEGSSLEFQYFDKPNITGRRVQVFVDVSYISTNTILSNANPTYIIVDPGSYFVVVPANSPSFELTGTGFFEPLEVPTSSEEQKLRFIKRHTGDRMTIISSSEISVTLERVDGALFLASYMIPMGFFDVKKCARQASTGIIKATCYNKLQSEYLDATANELIDAAVAEGEWGLPDNTASLRTILDRTLGDYSIEVAPDIAQTIAPYGNYRSYNSTVYTRLNSSYQRSGYYMHIFYLGHYVSIPGGFKSDSYYRISIDPKAIDNYFEAKRTSMIRDGNDNLYEFTSVDLQPGETAGTYYTYYDASSTPNYERLIVTNGDQTQTLSYSFLTNREIDNYDTGWLTGLSGDRAVLLYLPIYYLENTYYNYPSLSDATKRLMDEAFEEFMPYLTQHMTIVERNLSEIEKKTFTLADVEAWGDVTLRDLQSAAFETVCQFGQLDRETDLFSGVELEQTVSESFVNSQIATLWADEDNVKKWRYLIITYKGLDENQQEKDFTLQRTVNADGTDDYNMSDNWLFRNLVWTAADIGAYADAMVAKMQNTTWFPFEMWAAGLPYLETGDEVQMTVGSEDYTSYILQRQLNGVQNLQDTYINGTLDIY